jgi:chromosomal replication initiation ATPase DnaA
VQAALTHDMARVGFVTYLVSVATGIDVMRIRAPTRSSAEAARARQIAMYLAHVGFSWPMARVGAAFGRDRTTASHACHRVEDLRDHPEFDAALEDLEAWIRAAPAHTGPSRGEMAQ